MAAKFSFSPTLADLSSRLIAAGVPDQVVFEITGLLTKRDRELEDYVNALEARLTAGGL